MEGFTPAETYTVILNEWMIVHFLHMVLLDSKLYFILPVIVNIINSINFKLPYNISICVLSCFKYKCPRGVLSFFIAA